MAQVCKDVPYKKCEKKEKCYDVEKTKCHKEPVKSCYKVYEEDCSHGYGWKKHCKKVPRTKCTTEYKKKCYPKWEKECKYYDDCYTAYKQDCYTVSGLTNFQLMSILIYLRPVS